MTTIDRARWIKERIEFLESQLQTSVGDEQRSMIESELDALRHEAGPSSRWSWLRRLVGFPSMPR